MWPSRSSALKSCSPAPPPVRLARSSSALVASSHTHLEVRAHHAALHLVVRDLPQEPRLRGVDLLRWCCCCWRRRRCGLGFRPLALRINSVARSVSRRRCRLGPFRGCGVARRRPRARWHRLLQLLDELPRYVEILQARAMQVVQIPEQQSARERVSCGVVAHLACKQRARTSRSCRTRTVRTNPAQCPTARSGSSAAKSLPASMQ